MCLPLCSFPVCLCEAFVSLSWHIFSTALPCCVCRSSFHCSFLIFCILQDPAAVAAAAGGVRAASVDEVLEATAWCNVSGGLDYPCLGPTILDCLCLGSTILGYAWAVPVRPPTRKLVQIVRCKCQCVRSSQHAGCRCTVGSKSDIKSTLLSQVHTLTKYHSRHISPYHRDVHLWTSKRNCKTALPRDRQCGEVPDPRTITTRKWSRQRTICPSKLGADADAATKGVAALTLKTLRQD